jgi:hypothetical protein
MPSLFWRHWRQVFFIVNPETVVKWRKEGFRLYLRWKSEAPGGRPKIDQEIRELIRRMSLENPHCGTPRIQSELRPLGFEVAERTVSKYRMRSTSHFLGKRPASLPPRRRSSRARQSFCYGQRVLGLNHRKQRWNTKRRRHEWRHCKTDSPLTRDEARPSDQLWLLFARAESWPMWRPLTKSSRLRKS